MRKFERGNLFPLVVETECETERGREREREREVFWNAEVRMLLG